MGVAVLGTILTSAHADDFDRLEGQVLAAVPKGADASDAETKPDR